MNLNLNVSFPIFILELYIQMGYMYMQGICVQNCVLLCIIECKIKRNILNLSTFKKTDL